MNESKNQSGTGGGTGAGTPADHVRQAFSALPLDEKFSTLIRIELDMLGDAVDTVVSAASKVVDDIARSCERSEQSASATPGAAGSATTS
jgi:uncharacterized spore protein YtfJ